MKIYITRHGQSNYNISGICNDSPSDNVYLTKLGVSQANILAVKLQNEHFDVIYISEFPRVKNTAEIINKFHSLPIKVDSRLNENKTGFNGKPVQDYVDEILKHKDYWNIRLNNGESFADVQNRIYSFINDLRKKEYKSVLIVAHSSTMKFFNGYFKNLSNEEIFSHKDIDNCEIIEFDI